MTISRTHRRAVAQLTRALLFFLVACGDPTPNDPGDGVTTARPYAGTPPGGAVDAPDAGAASRAEDVYLHVRDRDGMPVVGRAVTTVDARGARRRVLTDEEGGIVFQGTVPPFDVIVEGAPSDGDAAVPTVFLGVSRTEVRLALDEQDPAPPPPQIFDLAMPASGPATAWIATISATGRGETATRSDDSPSGALRVARHRHVFRAAPTSPRDAITVHVVERARGGTAFRHARRDAGSPSPGAVHDLGTIMLADVPADEIHVDVVPDDSRRGAAVATAATLVFEDGAALELGRAGAELTATAPRIAGARLCARAWAQHPPASSADVHAGARSVRCEARAAGPRSVTLTFAPAVTIAAPAPGTSFSARGPGIVLVPAASGRRVVRLAFVEESRERVAIRVHASDDEIRFERLARLGVRRLAPGALRVELEATEDMDIDDLVDAHAAVRDEVRIATRHHRFTVRS